MDFNDRIFVPKKDNSQKAKDEALEKLMNYKINRFMNIEDFERSVHRLFDLAFDGFDTYLSYDRCFEKLGVDEEFTVQPNFEKYNAPELLWLLDSICHIDRRNNFELMKFFIKSNYIKKLMLELKKKQEHIFDEVPEDFFERG